MIISVINHTNGKIVDAAVQRAIRAVNRQITEDFALYWGFGATLRLEGKVGERPDEQALADMRGEAILYIWDTKDVDEALGYHAANFKGIPYGFVFTQLAKELGENWTVTFSHEALELVGDPQANLVVQGPHPGDGGRMVFHWFEMCDAVQAEAYRIDGVGVSNFVLPLYFTSDEQPGGRNDFLGKLHRGKMLESFGVAPGGYVGFFDPEKKDDDTYFVKSDRKAARRLALKRAAGTGRGNQRRGRTAALSAAGIKDTIARRKA